MTQLSDAIRDEIALLWHERAARGVTRPLVSVAAASGARRPVAASARPERQLKGISKMCVRQAKPGRYIYHSVVRGL